MNKMFSDQREKPKAPRRIPARPGAEPARRVGAHVDAAYFCPHHPLFTGPCDCRKPGSKLFREAHKKVRETPEDEDEPRKPEP